MLTAPPLSQDMPLELSLDSLDLGHLTWWLNHGRLLPPVQINCQQVRCRRTLGVAYLVSQLLRLRAAGATVVLTHVDATMRRALDRLALTPLFSIVGAQD
ncbi:hypothetical protein [Hymenobacter weizhouensis]|uniref:hypothetical protein n=1 Tax=Hymenobacter sp. YIM 151500-1 TaxID=2987689 RepID=UPI0022266C63|nr:hypothetical protein [Hymenobacter sp. YIM 151500-1]UYZ64662.1 hypothetical protein OIS53_07380 [Hymenobacter sp. YIM 151500-1]